jgi:hypothetical protein
MLQVWARDYSAEDPDRCDCDALQEALGMIQGARRMVCGPSNCAAYLQGAWAFGVKHAVTGDRSSETVCGAVHVRWVATISSPACA